MAGIKMNVEFPTRLCEVNGKLGYFHRWEQWSKVVDASPLRGGHPGGQNGQVFGIVEFEDGVRRVGPSSIKFCDEENAILCEMAKHHEALRRGEAKGRRYLSDVLDNAGTVLAVGSSALSIALAIQQLQKKAG